LVKGLDIFREFFAPYSGEYVLIGGTAASLAMEEAGLEFRSTKDLDIVLMWKPWPRLWESRLRNREAARSLSCAGESLVMAAAGIPASRNTRVMNRAWAIDTQKPSARAWRHSP
jgi:hypothetical protein